MPYVPLSKQFDMGNEPGESGEIVDLWINLVNRVKILAQLDLERTGPKDKIESTPRDPKKVEGQERNILSSMLSAPFLSSVNGEVKARI